MKEVRDNHFREQSLLVSFKIIRSNEISLSCVILSIILLIFSKETCFLIIWWIFVMLWLPKFAKTATSKHLQWYINHESWGGQTYFGSQWKQFINNIGTQFWDWQSNRSCGGKIARRLNLKFQKNIYNLLAR